MTSAVRPFPIGRLRAALIAILFAGSFVHGWILIAGASPATGDEQTAVLRTVVAGGLIRIGLGTLIILALTHAIRIRDRKLAEYASELEQMVAQRTQLLDRRGREMRLVLDHVDQGLVTIDLDGVMDGERSAPIDRWLGPVAAGATFGALVAPRAPAFAIWFELGLEALRERALPVEVVLAQLPRRFVADGRQLEVDYSPILERDRVRRLLLVVSDVTARNAKERAERGERELMAVFARIGHDRAGFELFLDEASELVDDLVHAPEPRAERRLLHTLKGDCRLEGLESFADLCHAIEDELAEAPEPRPLAPAQRERLRTGWAELRARVAQLLGGDARQVVEIERRELLATVDRLRHGGGGRELAAQIAAWASEPVARRFERLAVHARQLARRLGKGELELVIKDGGVRLDPGRWTEFWRGLLHVVTNAVDHGLEPPTERVAAGKPARGLVTLAARTTARGLEVTVADDGRGVDWDAVRARARAGGLPCATTEELEAALFADGVTTRDEVTATSGRGVGLAVLREAVAGLGGTMELATAPQVGTTLTFHFPLGPLAAVPGGAPRATAAAEPVRVTNLRR